MLAPGQQLSPAELASLEAAFAADPASVAYRPLAEAYLAMGRFMEAMVVCKRGVKSHPSDPAPRLLLARVYATQGRQAKALEEVRGALAIAPDDVPALRLSGALQLEAGDRDPGTEALRKAWEIAPGDAETAAAMKRFGISFEPVVSRPSTGSGRTEGAGSVQAEGAYSGRAEGPGSGLAEGPGSGRAEGPGSGRTEGGGSGRAERAGSGLAEPGGTEGAEGTLAAAEVASGGGTAVEAAAYAAQLASRYATEEHALPRSPRRRSRGRLVATAGLGLALALALAAWGVTSSIRKSRAVEIDRLLRQAREQIEKDSYASYQEAAALCRRILDRDRDSLGGHAYLAYVDAIRWGELGDGEPVHADLEKQLAAVKALGRGHSHSYAAQAYQRLYAGDARGAIDELRQVLTGPEGASALLHGVLGVVQLQAGDLDGAREALAYAHEHAPGDVRATQMLAEQWRRRGQGFEPQASALYDAILTRLEPDHVPSLLGKAQLLLDAGHPAEALKRITRVLQLGPAAAPRQVAVAHALRGSVLHAQGKAGEGDAEEQRALALDGSNADVHDLVGRRKLRAGDAAGAVASFQRAIQHEPSRLGFYVDFVTALMRKPGGAREAVAALQRASEGAGNARVIKLLGDAYRAAGDLDAARGSYQKAIAMEQRYPEARVALAAVHRQQSQYPSAVDELQRALAEYGEGTPAAATAWSELAEVEQARGSPVALVEKAYEAARTADPQSCPALYWLGRNRRDARLLSEYVRLCPRGPQVAEAERALKALRRRR